MAMTLDDVKVPLDTLVADVQRAILVINDLVARLAATSEEDSAKIQGIVDEITAASAALEEALPAEPPTPTE